MPSSLGDGDIKCFPHLYVCQFFIKNFSASVCKIILIFGLKHYQGGFVAGLPTSGPSYFLFAEAEALVLCLSSLYVLVTLT